MFKRRTRLRWTRRLREMIWPSMGWRRASRYVGHRIVRLKDSNYSICAGLAIGAAISFTPVPGLHILQAAGLALLMRGNVIASFIGTFVGNPWTIPFMWWASYEVGEWAFRLMGFDVKGMPAEFTLHNLLAEIEADPYGLMLPWLFGGYALTFISWFIFYGIFYSLLGHMRAQRINWKENRMQRVSREMMEPKS